MAAATATVAVDTPRPMKMKDSDLALLSGSITVVGDYATGGVAVAGISSRFKDLRRVIVSGSTVAAQYDVATDMLLLYGDNAVAAAAVLAEPNTVTLASTVFDFIAIGR